MVTHSFRLLWLFVIYHLFVIIYHFLSLIHIHQKLTLRRLRWFLTASERRESTSTSTENDPMYWNKILIIKVGIQEVQKQNTFHHCGNTRRTETKYLLLKWEYKMYWNKILIIKVGIQEVLKQNTYYHCGNTRCTETKYSLLKWEYKMYWNKMHIIEVGIQDLLKQNTHY